MGFTLLMFSGVYVITAQQPSREDLERRRSNIMNEIAATQQLLAETRKEKNVSLTQLRALKAKLAARERLIDNINMEMSHINNNIVSSDRQIKDLSKNLDALKMRYAQSIRYAYKNQQSQNMLAFLFSADDFNDALRRFQYMKKSRDFRKNQAGKIQATQGQLQKQIGILSSEKNKKVELLKVEEGQKEEIKEETQQTDQMVAELKGKEGDLADQIQRSKVAAKRLDVAIKAEIQREVEIARKKALEEAQRKAAAEEARRKAAEELARKQAAEEESRRKAEADRQKAIADAKARDAANKTGKPASGPASGKPLNPGRSNNTATATSAKPPETKPVAINETKPDTRTGASAPTVPAARPTPSAPPSEKPSYKLSLTPEVQALSNNFAANHGRLPWPVEKGYIALPFGRYKHPLEPKVMMDNSGIDIASGEGAGVRCVFEGTVSRVVNIGGGYTIIVNHGEYFSVYSFLKSVSVRQGDKVGFKQAIGTVGKNDDGENMLHFEICRINANNSISNVNPAEWIAR